MPTPIAHALGGIAASCLAVAGSSLALRKPASRRSLETVIRRIGPGRGVIGAAALGVVPDVDLLFGMHRGVTHSLGAVLLAAAIAGGIAPAARLPAALTAAAAFASHLLLDWLGTDRSPPLGIMAWWPWSDRFHLSDTPLFLRVCREYWSLDCWRHNALAVAVELFLLVPITLGALLVARRSLRGKESAMRNDGR